MRIGVLVSGRGSNLRALLAAYPSGHPLVQVAVVISNREGCGALEHARAAGIAAAVFPRERFASRAAQHQAIADALQRSGAELVVLAGYDQIITAVLLDAFPGRVINVHPSLLPAFAGTLHAQEEAVRYGVKVSGCTVHFVEQAVDSGPIIAQATVPVYDHDSGSSLADRILQEEHRLLPLVVGWLAEGRVRVIGRRVFID